MEPLKRPPFDPSFLHLVPSVNNPPAAASSNVPPPTDADMLQGARSSTAQLLGTSATSLRDRGLTVDEVEIPGPRGSIRIVIVRGPNQLSARDQTQPAIFHLHGGGMIAGDAYTGLSMFQDWTQKLDVVVFSVDYRLAPEHPGLAPVEDCYAALEWVVKHAGDYNIDKTRVAVAGISAGAGLSAALALMARDRGAPSIHSLMLGYPMLDDRNQSTSVKQFWKDGTFTGEINEFSWRMILGERAGGPDVSAYESPSRATDLSDLPQTFIDVGSVDPFRDECVDFASRLWQVGVQAELHIWPGGPHGFEMLATDTPLAQQALSARFEWFQRVLLSSTAGKN